MAKQSKQTSKSASKNKQISEQTKQESMAIAKGIQKPGQTKEQTKLIAQGIQKGIDQYKKQQKAKARAIDKANKKVAARKEEEPTIETVVLAPQNNRLPWILLALSWVLFTTFFVVTFVISD